jgi:TPR repeat protein
MDNLYDLIKKADSGDTEAQYKAADYILHEIDLDDNESEIVEKVFSYLRNAAMSGFYHGVAALELGEQYLSGRHIEKDYKNAVMWFRAAILKKQPIGYYHLGCCFLRGLGVPQDFAKAFDSFLKGSLTGYINNTIMLGDMFKKGEFVNTDYEYAVRLYQHVFDSELDLYAKNDFYSIAYGQVCLRLGECYLNGNGVEKDIEEANYYYAEAKKHTEDEYWVEDENPYLLQLMNKAPFPLDGTVVDKIASEDVDLASLFAEKLPVFELSYYPENELNTLYAINPSITKFEDENFTDIFDGVQAGDARQMYKLAIICFQGDVNSPKNSVLKDYGVYLFHKSLLGGCTDALEILGLCYFHGDCVEQSYETALFLFSLSKYPMAFGEIGVCYANGKGVERDYLTAYFYFAKYLLLDNKRAGETYENLTIIYPHLICFEQDQMFIDYCHKASKEYISDENDNL